MSNVFVIMHSEKIFNNEYFESNESARDFITQKFPKKNFKEPVPNTFVLRPYGSKYEIVELGSKSAKEKKHIARRQVVTKLRKKLLPNIFGSFDLMDKNQITLLEIAFEAGANNMHKFMSENTNQIIK